MIDTFKMQIIFLMAPNFSTMIKVSIMISWKTRCFPGTTSTTRQVPWNVISRNLWCRKTIRWQTSRLNTPNLRYYLESTIRFTLYTMIIIVDKTLNFQARQIRTSIERMPMSSYLMINQSKLPLSKGTLSQNLALINPWSTWRWTMITRQLALWANIAATLIDSI